MNHYFSFQAKFSFFAYQAIEYEVGDVLEILPSQNSAAVDAFMLRCNLDPESFITVSSFSCVLIEHRRQCVSLCSLC